MYVNAYIKRQINRFMGCPCDEILGNHSKGLPRRFYTLWAKSETRLSIDFNPNHMQKVLIA